MASMLLMLLAAVISGSVGALSKISLKEIPPLPFTLVRFVLTALVLLPFVIGKRKRAHLKNLKSVIFLSLLATLNVTLYIVGLERTTATVSQMLYAGVPLAAGVFSYFLLKEALSFRKIFGILIGFFGVLGIILLPIFKTDTPWNGDLWGNLITLVGVCSFALYSVLSKQFQKEYSPLELTAYFVFTTIPVQLLLIPFDVAHNQNWWSTISPETIGAIAYVGIMGTGFYYVLYQYMIKTSTPLMASMLFYLQPIFAFLWAALLLGEKITPEFLIGALLAFLGVALVTNFGRPEVKAPLSETR